MKRLRGYMVYGGDTSEGALLVFDHTAKDAKRRGWRTIFWDYETVEEYIEVRVLWLRDADPKEWGVTEPCILEPAGCTRCDLWHSRPVDKKTNLCRDCSLEDD